jgi:aminoglycoside phosphotransferase (APT) family kinase protein
LVRGLIAEQFPQWAELPVRAVLPGGWDNRMFRLGDAMVVRLPSQAAYETQVHKEQHWLPVLAPALPVAVPRPLALGRPSSGYPCAWSVLSWIEAEPASLGVHDCTRLALQVAEFLRALQRIDASAGPPAGAHSFHRGGALSVYDHPAREAITRLQDRIDTEAAHRVWTTALDSAWQQAPVWVHGDVSVGNLLMNEQGLCAVIDFGNLAVGDPACDLALAWTLFNDRDRDVFLEAMDLDDATWARARGWVLWKALIVAAGLAQTNAVDWQKPWRLIDRLLNDARGA